MTSARSDSGHRPDKHGSSSSGRPRQSRIRFPIDMELAASRSSGGGNGHPSPRGPEEVQLMESPMLMPPTNPRGGFFTERRRVLSANAADPTSGRPFVRPPLPQDANSSQTVRGYRRTVSHTHTSSASRRAGPSSLNSSYNSDTLLPSENTGKPLLFSFLLALLLKLLFISDYDGMAVSL